MPPENKNPSSASELAAFHRWIADGAKTGSDQTAANGPTAAVTQHDVIRSCCAAARPATAAPAGSRTRPAHEGGDAPRRQVGTGHRPGQARREPAPQADPRRRDAAARAACRGQRQADRAGRAATSSPAGSPPAPPEVDSRAGRRHDEPDPLVTDKDRDFWAFRPPQAGRGPGRWRSPRRCAIRSTLSCLQKLEAAGADALARGRPRSRCCGGPVRSDRAAARAGGSRSLSGRHVARRL